ncbi:unnamed protein product [Bursaphelenchus xylophilus]|uniref:(pine wood nematode) hypothetical protein n=1 Tax=Bursaphelenchus xylophilus TaxID=6326 RepID=A0A1I7RUM5_BURXY|nr:unnamed protein product [Bursaphelenchus xylophilus]CAG9114227.1 unnamed protein product [Bursaphelenchus xylophilus]
MDDVGLWIWPIQLSMVIGIAWTILMGCGKKKKKAPVRNQLSGSNRQDSEDKPAKPSVAPKTSVPKTEALEQGKVEKEEEKKEEKKEEVKEEPGKKNDASKSKSKAKSKKSAKSAKKEPEAVEKHGPEKKEEKKVDPKPAESKKGTDPNLDDDDGDDEDDDETLRNVASLKKDPELPDTQDESERKK